ncbi:MAG TPA: chromate transporter [Candidatus Binatus sp.]|uniref:chromate transporter n=1 Tax=Candidatus Binatus sp. TaxID=2811406 RepID=UPI002B473EF7|nr:chromate transporter [Candidatus Binatus sp.]HKN14075.1 chromate transporter [Candidatus Binatus sp.]
MEQPRPPSSTDTEIPVSNTKSEPDLHPSLLTLFRIFLLAGGLSFGGGAVAYLREYLVRDEGWLDDEGFLGAMEISETLPGLNAVNMAIIMGDNLRGIAGAAVSVIGMLLPGSIVVMVLGILYQSNHSNPELKRFLLGIAAAAVGLLSAVTLQIGRRQFRQLPDIAIVIITFLAVSSLKLQLFVVLLGIGPISVWLYRPHVSKPRAEDEHLPFHRGARHHLFRH